MKNRKLELTQRTILVLFVLCLAFSLGEAAEKPKKPNHGREAFYQAVLKAATACQEDELGKALKFYKDFREKYPESKYQGPALLAMATISQVEEKDVLAAYSFYHQARNLPGEDKLSEVSRRVAKAWAGKLQLAVLKDLLEEYYARQVRYPLVLDQLATARQISGENLRVLKVGVRYKCLPCSLFPELKRQEYRLELKSGEKESKPAEELRKDKIKAMDGYRLQGIMRSSAGAIAGIECRKGKKPEMKRVRPRDKIGEDLILEIGDRSILIQTPGELLIVTMGRGKEEKK